MGTTTSKRIEELNNMLKELMNYDRESIRAFLSLTKSTHRKGAIDSKYKELIALALAVYKGCEHCIAYHLSQALRLGASSDEIKEVLLVVLAMGGGTVSSSIVFSLNTLADLLSGDIR